jgi:hypothetical protein
MKNSSDFNLPQRLAGSPMKYLSLALVILIPGVLLSQALSTVASSARETRIQEKLPVASSASAMSASVSKAMVTPVLDGKLDDPAWQNAQSINSFLEYDPNQGADSRFKTDVRIVHDDKYLYVMARMYDPAPDSIVSLLSRRDVRTQSEQLKLVIDSYHDRQTAYQLARCASTIQATTLSA